jgi:tetratricopeptide (TPR) repeat protein
MQHHDGDVRDPALRALIQELAARNAGLLLVTTRVRLTDIADDTPIDLDNLSPGDGALYLKHLGIDGDDDELRDASESYDNHALALTLLGTYLKTFCQSDVRRRTDIKELETDLTKPGRQARKVMASYARMYKGRPELDILRALGYFDRPADPEALKLVLPEMNPMAYQAALTTLQDTRLVLTTDLAKPIDCHPLIREHFGAEATKEGHLRLYEYFRNQAPYHPDTLREMEPLFHAIYHGCQAGRFDECLDTVYYDRIRRADKAYLNWELAANATDLSLLANFFERPWIRPAVTLSNVSQGWVISQAGFALLAVGRLADAAEPTRVAVESFAKSGHWKQAAAAYVNLVNVQLRRGNIPEAVIAARQSVVLADRSGDLFVRMGTRTSLAESLRLSGDLVGALSLFQEAERLQTERQPEYPILYGGYGYQYCELLLARGETAEVIRRASQTLSWASRAGILRDIGLDHLSLGRAHSGGSAESTHHLNKAVEYIRRAGHLFYLLRALLARGRPDDLAETYRIASRCGMGLYLKDPRLANFKKEAATA